MYRLEAADNLAYEMTELDGRPFHFLVAHLRVNPQGVRDVIIALNTPAWVPKLGKAIVLDAQQVDRLIRILGGMNSHCLDVHFFHDDFLGNLDGSYAPEWTIHIPKRLIPQRVIAHGRPLIMDNELVFLAAYNNTHNVLFAADFVHDLGNVVRKEVAKAFVDFLRDVGVPIPYEPIGEAREWSVFTVRFPEERITLGADPEFELVKERRIVRASGAVRREVQLPWGAIGVDGAGDPLELRPLPETTPRGLVNNVGRLLLSVPKLVGGAPSTMCEVYPIGGHIHIGFEHRDSVMRYADEIVGAIDEELGGIFYSLNSSKRLRSAYGERRDWRPQEWGIEYRTPPAAIWSHPEVAMTFLEGVAHIATNLVRAGEWDPHQDPVWPRVKERVRRAADLVKKYEGRLHWGAWKKWVGDFHLTHESGVDVEFALSAEHDEGFLDDLRLTLLRLGLPGVRVLPLRRSRGDHVSNVRGYGTLVEGISEFIPDLTLALSWRFRNDPAFRREEIPKLEEAIARLLDGGGDDGNRLIKEVISLDGDWPDQPPPEPVGVGEDEDEDDEYTTCDECGREIRVDDAYYDRNDTPYCADCYYETYTTCEGCGGEVLREYAYRYGDHMYCEDCFNERFAYCENCEEDYPVEEVELVRVARPNGLIEEMALCVGCREDLEYDGEHNVYREVE